MTETTGGERYVTLVDVVDSREIGDRGAFEERLQRALAAVNDAERDSLATPLTQMKGIDEFGCVLTRLSALPAVVAALLDRIHPATARFGVASGEIDVGEGSDTVAEMDGPGFHRASELLDGVEERGLYVDVDTGRPTDGLVASALDLLLLEREGLTERQVEVALAYEEHGTQTAAGEALGLEQQAVSKTLQRANYARRRQIRANLRESLEATYD